MTGELERVLKDVRDELLEEPVSPRVGSPREINRHYCRHVAETVADRVDDPDLRILEDGGRGFAHVWLARDGRHRDAECVEGVADYTDLPFFQRHPGAAMHPEPESVDQSALRRRGRVPLYPDL